MGTNLLVKEPINLVLKTLEVLGQLGVSPQDFQSIRSNPEIALRAALGIRNAHLPIIDLDLFGQDEWWVFYSQLIKDLPDFPLTPEQLDAPCPLTPGKKVGETHFVFLKLDKFYGQGTLESVKPITINFWLEALKGVPFVDVKDKKLCKDFPTVPLAEQRFTSVPLTERVKYCVIFKGMVPHSETYRYQDAVKLLPPGYRVPTAVELFTAQILFRRKYRRFFKLNTYARYTRCSDQWEEDSVSKRHGKEVAVGIDTIDNDIHNWKLVINHAPDRVDNFFGIGAVMDLNHQTGEGR